MDSKQLAQEMLELWLREHPGWSGDPTDDGEAEFLLEDGETGAEFFVGVTPAE